MKTFKQFLIESIRGVLHRIDHGVAPKFFGPTVELLEQLKGKKE